MQKKTKMGDKSNNMKNEITKSINRLARRYDEVDRGFTCISTCLSIFIFESKGYPPL